MKVAKARRFRLECNRSLVWRFIRRVQWQLQALGYDANATVEISSKSPVGYREGDAICPVQTSKCRPNGSALAPQDV